ncbi:hypothetical protein GB937_010842 [Aspergillus fischeri]|nr:hypothetical protein GB937_010842 [Aspergillus fischeri]
MGLVATTQVVTRADYYGKASLVQPGNREWALPPYIIFKGKVHIEGWYQDFKLPRDSRIEVSPNGWTTDEIGLCWLKNLFIPATTSPISRLNSIKYAVKDYSYLHASSFFPQASTPGCGLLRAFKKGVWELSGAESAGLVPFNPDRVLSQLEIQLKTPTPPGTPKTPYTIRQLKKQASAIKKLLREHAHSPLPLLESRLDKIIKGHELMLNELVLTREEIRRSRAENEWKG